MHKNPWLIFQRHELMNWRTKEGNDWFRKMKQMRKFNRSDFCQTFERSAFQESGLSCVVFRGKWFVKSLIFIISAKNLEFDHRWRKPWTASAVSEELLVSFFFDHLEKQLLVSMKIYGYRWNNQRPWCLFGLNAGNFFQKFAFCFSQFFIAWHFLHTNCLKSPYSCQQT